MRLNLKHYFGAGVVVIAFIIATQSLTYIPKENASGLSNLEALTTLTQTRFEGRELTTDEIASGAFHTLRLRIEGMSCISCSDTVFLGLVNMNGIVNADIGQGTSCITYDGRETTDTEILDSELFTTGIYMAMKQGDSVIASEGDAACL